ncbi:MAG: hypothetical protein WC505_04890 [Patescibacteria group bacterium]
MPMSGRFKTRQEELDYLQHLSDIGFYREEGRNGEIIYWLRFYLEPPENKPVCEVRIAMEWRFISRDDCPEKEGFFGVKLAVGDAEHDCQYVARYDTLYEYSPPSPYHQLVLGQRVYALFMRWVRGEIVEFVWRRGDELPER